MKKGINIIMKKIRKCSAICFVLGCWVLLSLIGFLGKDTIYSRYSHDIKKKPYFVLVFEGIHDGVYPWSQKTTSLWEKWEQIAQERHENEIEEGVLSTEMEAGDSETEDLEEENVTETAAKEDEKENDNKDNADAAETEENEIREFQTVEKDYFSDAIFIGDSRTVGLHDYGGLDDAVFYATVGMNVYDLWEKEHCVIDGKKMSLEQLLSSRKFKKIYFQIGINEMGRGTVDGFIEAYRQSIEKFHELQPEAVIFIQGIMKVAKTKSEQDAIFNNEGIEERNQRIAELEDKKNIFYLDMNEVVCDEEGNLRSDLTFDDVHLYGSKYDAWVQFLLEHGIE